MLTVLLLAILCCMDAFVLRAPHSSLNTLCTIANAFEAFSMIPEVKTITIRTASNRTNCQVLVLAHVVCNDGDETWINSTGPGLFRACENCANDALLEILERSSE